MKPAWCMLVLGAFVAGWTVIAGGQAPRPPLNYGFTNALIENASPTDARAASLQWAKGVADSLGVYDGATAEVYRDVPAVLSDLKAGRLDALALSSREYLAFEKQLPVVPILVWDIGGEVMSTYVLLSRHDRLSEEHLRGKTIAIYATDRTWNLADPWLDSVMAGTGVTNGRDLLSGVRYVTKRGHAALAVFFGQADYAVETLSSFKTAVELNPQLGQQLRVIAQSQPMLPGVVCVATRVGPDLPRLMLERVTRLHENTRYRQTFLVLRVTRLVAFQAPMLDSVRALVGTARTGGRR